MNDNDFHNIDTELPHFLSQIIDIHINWEDEKEVDNYHEFRNKFVELVEKYTYRGE
jgi:hypothetical protein